MVFSKHVTPLQAVDLKHENEEYITKPTNNTDGWLYSFHACCNIKLMPTEIKSKTGETHKH